MIAALIVLALLLLLALLAVGVLAMLWRAAVNDLHQAEGLLRGKCAELDALSIAPPAAIAALQPDHPALPDDGASLADEIEGWLAGHTPNGDVK